MDAPIPTSTTRRPEAGPAGHSFPSPPGGSPPPISDVRRSRPPRGTRSGTSCPAAAAATGSPCSCCPGSSPATSPRRGAAGAPAPPRLPHPPVDPRPQPGLHRHDPRRAARAVRRAPRPSRAPDRDRRLEPRRADGPLARARPPGRRRAHRLPRVAVARRGRGEPGDRRVPRSPSSTGASRTARARSSTWSGARCRCARWRSTRRGTACCTATAAGRTTASSARTWSSRAATAGSPTTRPRWSRWSTASRCASTTGARSPGRTRSRRASSGVVAGRRRDPDPGRSPRRLNQAGCPQPVRRRRLGARDVDYSATVAAEVYDGR